MVDDMAMLVTGVSDGAMVVFIFVVGDVPMLLTGVTDDVMVLFIFVIGDVVTVLTHQETCLGKPEVETRPRCRS
jgi:hypothetical protein